MGVNWNRGTEPPEDSMIADRNLYLNKAGDTVVEEGSAESASQLVARGHAITREEANRLGLSVKDGKIVQGDAQNTDDHRENVAKLEAAAAEINAKADAYRKENATKDIPNTLEAERVALEARLEQARVSLAQAIKAEKGKDPFKGESQATALKPDLDKTDAEKKADEPDEK